MASFVTVDNCTGFPDCGHIGQPEFEAAKNATVVHSPVLAPNTTLLAVSLVSSTNGLAYLFSIPLVSGFSGKIVVGVYSDNSGYPDKQLTSRL